MNENNGVIIPEELILKKIYQIRGQKVMLDMDLAEFNNLRSQFGTSRWGGIRYPPMAFSEQGVAMLSSALNSHHAILVNIRIIRIFGKMRELLMVHKEINDKLIKIEQ